MAIYSPLSESLEHGFRSNDMGLAETDLAAMEKVAAEGNVLKLVCCLLSCMGKANLAGEGADGLPGEQTMRLGRAWVEKNKACRKAT